MLKICLRNPIPIFHFQLACEAALASIWLCSKARLSSSIFLNTSSCLEQMCLCESTVSSCTNLTRTNWLSYKRKHKTAGLSDSNYLSIFVYFLHWFVVLPDSHRYEVLSQVVREHYENSSIRRLDFVKLKERNCVVTRKE